MSGKEGCNSCTVIFDYYSHITGISHGLSSKALVGVTFRIPVLDFCYPMGLPNVLLLRVSRRFHSLPGVGQAAAPEIDIESIQGSNARGGHETRLLHELVKEKLVSLPPGANRHDTSRLMLVGDAIRKLDSLELEGWLDWELEVSTSQISQHKMTATPHDFHSNQKENLRRQNHIQIYFWVPC